MTNFLISELFNSYINVLSCIYMYITKIKETFVYNFLSFLLTFKMNFWISQKLIKMIKKLKPDPKVYMTG
jgi:hypothetical protein